MKKKTKDQEPGERTEAADAEGHPLDSPVPGEAGGQGRGELEQELARLKQERDQLEAKLQRAMADLQNFRRRQLQELEQVRRRTLEGLAQELLPVLDNFELALQAHDRQSRSGPVDAASILEGLRMVQSLLDGALERHGLTKIPAEDLPFDPNLHEAVGVEPREDVAAGTVVRVLQDGYTIADRVIRPSKVMVSGAIADERGGEPPEGGSEGESDDQQQH